MIGALRSLLRFAGKGETKVAAVFGFNPESCYRAVAYLREGAPGVPIWLFSQAAPSEETAALCQVVCVNRSSLALLLEAERRLWPHWVAIGVATWTGERGKWPLKVAPFLIPPFRALVFNDNGDFMAGTPPRILGHCVRRLRDALACAWGRVCDLAKGCWLLASYHIWRSGPVTRVKDEATGVALWLASLVLRMLSFSHGGLQHRLFHRMHGSEPLEVTAAPAEGGEVMRFCQKGPHWSPARLERAVRASNARWVLWRENEQAPDAIEDMLPLFARERTFAVSRQTHFRAWKPLLFPAAPFRTLQPGESSQVLAPLSSSILVERGMLLALGIPRCSLAGTAWMILFWKAAAAGWRSYSAGQAGALREQPDLPMQETGFLAHLLWHKAVRRLGPREPDLSRGSIAFSAAGHCSGSASLKVLIVSPFLPYPLSHGGAVRIYNLCRALSGRVEFVLAAVREKEDVVRYDKLRDVFRDVYVVDKDERPSADEHLPDQVRQHESRSLRALVAEVARTWKPDLLQIEYTHLAAVRDAAPEIPAILVEHDLTFSLYRQLADKKGAGVAAQREFERWLEFERRWLGVYDGVWTVSEEDRESAIREGRRPAERTFAIANGVDIERFQPRDEATPVPEIFYVGSFRHLPNIIGFEKLRQEVMPWLWSSFPHVRLRVVAGPQHEEFWKRFARQSALPQDDGRIQIHGFVEDLRPLYATAAVVVVPLEVSAGTNIKVLEAMACGKAVVTTPIGCAGLGLRHRRDALIEADWAAFARAVGELLSDGALRSSVAAQARRTAEERFSWTAIAGAAYESYRTLLRRAPANPPAAPASTV
ncbi:MAG TPA: glycosyltransferase family 4 protein [Bryobacteraceae bacterium]|nr:glycosyltransferase family 4 protein [Bryobacteraceae bacterium]